MRKRILPLLLATCLTFGLATPALAADTAAAIRLSKTTGTVTVSKSSEKKLTLMDNMRLYNGYHVVTSAKSYAWMNLDDTKLIKEDAASEAEVRKSGRNLEVNVCSGSVFFNVSEKLEDDESLNISTSTMITGIRGTAGYVQVVDRWTTLLTVLEGEVQCSVSDPVTGQIKTETVRGGETVTCVVYPQDKTGDKCDILRDKLEVDGIPGFVLYDVVRDMDLCDRIEEDTGTDILEELAKVVGGDPSGRSPDGTSASPEILGEADRRQDQDEDDLQRRQDEVDTAVEEQDTGDSPDKVFNPTGDSSGGSSDSGSSGGGGSSAQTATTATMPVTAQELRNLLNQYNSVTLQPSANTADNTLDASGLTVPAGKTLDIQDGIQTSVPAGGNLQVNGTLNGGSMDNQGTTTVSSSNTLRLRGNLTSSGTLTVTSTGRVVVDGSWSVSALTLSSGAQVLSKSGFGSTPLTGWAVSETADSSGYYYLEYTGETPPSPVTYTITFNANGGAFADGGDTITVNIDENGVLTEDSLPDEPTRTGYTCDGWYTAAAGGTRVTGGEAFDGDTTLYAHWTEDAPSGPPYTVTFNTNGGEFESGETSADFTTGDDGVLTGAPANQFRDSETAEYDFAGWFDAPTGGTEIADLSTYVFDADTTLYAHWTTTAYTGDGWRYRLSDNVLQITNDAEMADFTSSGDQPWATHANFNPDDVKQVTIDEGVTKIGEYAFADLTNVTSVDIGIPWTMDDSGKTSFTNIGAHAFDGCTGLTTLAISEGVESIGASAFNGCTGLTSIRFPTTMKSITQSAFTGCNNLKNVYYAGDRTTWATIGVVGDSGADAGMDPEAVFPAQSEGEGVTVNYSALAITFDADGGTFDNGSETMICYTGDTGKVTAPANPTKTGFTFNGWWSTSGNGIGTQYDFSNDTFDADDTVYARWTETTP